MRGAPAGEAKLLLASADAEATRAFVRALRGLPGMQPSRAARGEGLAPTDLLPVGWLTVDESVRIELLHVPADPAFSACWPAVAQDSLGALVVLQHPAAESEAALRPLLVALRDHGADRIFHVLLLPKGERLAAEELQPSLTLLDEASLFLVPMEGQRDPIGLMRAALDRVLP